MIIQRRVKTFHITAPAGTILVTHTILQTKTLIRNKILYDALVFVDYAALLALICVIRTLQLTVACGAALFAAVSIAFQTTSPASATLNTGISFTYN